ncbi:MULTISPECIES: JAB domain-containing protein [Halomonadaceae]|uniref:JAB domain-containing protein n=1 Tax=Halomonadaceae TaxID=28256 RepID=UPI001EE38713|nr:MULTISPECIES: JAB domain-containing protein [Halomonas]
MGPLPKPAFNPGVFKSALIYDAAAVILVHNHSSGDPEPSDSDNPVTQRPLNPGSNGYSRGRSGGGWEQWI